MSSILIITCSSGGGHLTAKENIAKRLTKEGHHLVELDIAEFFYPVENIVAQLWDAGIRHDWRIVHDIANAQTFYEAAYETLYAKRLSARITDIIKNNQIDTIYDTQPTMTNLLVDIFSKACDQGDYHKVFTDLPYPGNRSYLRSLKRCKHKENIHLYVHAPDTVPSPELAHFWDEYAGIANTQVKKTFALPVHELYLNAPLESDTFTLPCALTAHCAANLKVMGDAVSIRPGTEVTTLMLGSQGLEATFEYAKQFLNQAASDPTPSVFFVACARNTDLYERIFAYANQHNLPHAQVLPLPKISQDILASIMWKSSSYVIRPSGLSCLEQLALRQYPENAQKPLMIHSGMSTLNREPSTLNNEFLLKGCHGHERANAEYMLAMTNAVMVTPGTVRFSTAIPGENWVING